MATVAAGNLIGAVSRSSPRLHRNLSQRGPKHKSLSYFGRWNSVIMTPDGFIAQTHRAEVA